MQKMRENSLSTLIVYICNFRHTSHTYLPLYQGVGRLIGI
nr:MAG TPA: hypothetical protein [Caudoviricetes sp.]